MQSFNKKLPAHCASVRLPKHLFINTYLRPLGRLSRNLLQFGKKPSAPRPDILRKTAVILRLPTRRLPSLDCLPPTKRRKEYFTPFTIRRQTAALIQQPLTPKQLQNICHNSFVCCNLAAAQNLRCLKHGHAQIRFIATTNAALIFVKDGDGMPSFPPAAGTTSPKGCRSSDSWLMMNCILSRRCSGPKDRLSATASCFGLPGGVQD